MVAKLVKSFILRLIVYLYFKVWQVNQLLPLNELITNCWSITVLIVYAMYQFWQKITDF